MSQETQIVIVRFLVPALFAAIGGWLLTRSVIPSPLADANWNQGIEVTTKQRMWSTILGALICSAGIVVSDFWARGILLNPAAWVSWEAKYQWNWLIWMLPAVYLVLAAVRLIWSERTHYTSVLWPALFLFAIVALYIPLVELEVWGDQILLVLNLILIGLVAIVSNTAALNELVTSRANRWAGLVLMGQFGCVAAVVLQSYGSLGELAIVGSAICFGLTIATLSQKFRPIAFGEWRVAIIAYPLISVAVSILLLSGFFQSKPLLPNWLFYIVLLLPTINWFFDYVYGRYGRVWWRIVLAAIVSSSVLAAILITTNPFASEW